MKQFLFAAIFFGFWSSPLAAEPVLIRAGESSVGQGWIFHHDSGCWIATAKHVVENITSNTQSVDIVGPDGNRATASGQAIYRSPDLDLALIRAVGALTAHCPVSLVGDRDLEPTLTRIDREGGKITFERREGDTVGTGLRSFGVAYVEVQLLGRSDKNRTFVIRSREARETFAQSDSGSPVVYAGTGPGETGLPLGLLLEIVPDGTERTAKVLRMDAVRQFLETIAAAAQKVTSRESGMALVSYGGTTTDASCGAQNVISPLGKTCGWRASRIASSQPISLVLDLGAVVSDIIGVQITVANGNAPAGFVVSTPLDPVNDPSLIAERHCELPKGNLDVSCTLGQRSSRFVRVVVDGGTAEITKINVLVQPHGTSKWPKLSGY